jgi:hypothetical protein
MPRDPDGRISLACRDLRRDPPGHRGVPARRVAYPQREGVRIPARTSMPRPDLVVRGEPRDYLTRYPEPADTALVVEVSITNLDDDPSIATLLDWYRLAFGGGGISLASRVRRSPSGPDRSARSKSGEVEPVMTPRSGYGSTERLPRSDELSPRRRGVGGPAGAPTAPAP